MKEQIVFYQLLQYFFNFNDRSLKLIKKKQKVNWIVDLCNCSCLCTCFLGYRDWENEDSKVVFRTTTKEKWNRFHNSLTKQVYFTVRYGFTKWNCVDPSFSHHRKETLWLQSWEDSSNFSQKTQYPSTECRKYQQLLVFYTTAYTVQLRT